MNAPRETVSWLLLERYALDELPESERRAVESALSSDDAARDCLALIRSDARTLPPLPVVPASSRPSRSWWSSFGWSAGALAATVAMLMLWPRMSYQPPETLPLLAPSRDTSIKGDAVAISLVREHGGSIDWDPSLFLSGDRFKLRVTCGADGESFANVVVHQAGAASFPLRPQAITCGNAVVLDGAFQFTEAQAARVCVVISSAGPLSPDQLRATDFAAANAACVTVNPAR